MDGIALEVSPVPQEEEEEERLGQTPDSEAIDRGHSRPRIREHPRRVSQEARPKPLEDEDHHADGDVLGPSIVQHRREGGAMARRGCAQSCD